METNIMYEVIRAKDNLLAQQTRRVELLEAKIVEMRKKYFQLKYSDVLSVFKENLLARENY
ncbi:MAG TPA: hypothetical protein VI757_12340 [Bacteroidia bacterium]|nr:hypothetical protein [Bacteroidia bacterium]